MPSSRHILATLGLFAPALFAPALLVLGLLVLGCAGPAPIEGVAEPSDAPGSDATSMSDDPSPSDALDAAQEPPCDGVADDQRPLAAGTGTLRLGLVQAAASGARYRLQGATFDLYDVQGGFSATLSTADASDPDRLEVRLPSGEYRLTLHEGWSLVSLDGGTANDSAAGVSAARLSPATVLARIGAGDEVAVRYRFEVERPGVEPTPRALAPSLGILERPGPLSGRVCVESPIAPEAYTLYAADELAPLEGCREIRGELSVVVPFEADLAPLSRLERVCGKLIIMRSVDVLPAETPAEQSLAGLESLEEVDALHIYHPGVRSFSPLARLRRIQRRDAATDVFGLYVSGSGLEDLSGLERVTEIQNVTIEQSDSLRSLRGLTLPSEMGSVQVGSPNLADLAALEGVRRVRDDVYIWADALEDLDALSSLRSADSITLSTSSLNDASGLRSLERANSLILSDGPLAAGPPVFEALTEVGDLMLLSLDARGVLGFPVLARAGKVDIGGNSNLESVSAPQLSRVERLTIRSNAALSALELPALSEAVMIDIIGNASLSDAATAPLLALGAPTTRVGGNAGSLLPLDPCPWAGDLICDEGYLGVCAPGTDGDDCRID